jgi:hypothetical protein
MKLPQAILFDFGNTIIIKDVSFSDDCENACSWVP